MIPNLSACLLPLHWCAGAVHHCWISKKRQGACTVSEPCGCTGINTSDRHTASQRSSQVERRKQLMSCLFVLQHSRADAVAGQPQHTKHTKQMRDKLDRTSQPGPLTLAPAVAHAFLSPLTLPLLPFPLQVNLNGNNLLDCPASAPGAVRSSFFTIEDAFNLTCSVGCWV